MTKKTPLILYTFILLALTSLTSCTPTPNHATVSNELPPLYPDYCGVTIPQNIAPLNFLVRDSAEAVYVTAGNITVSARGNAVVFDEDDWRSMTEKEKKVTVTVTTLRNGKWTQYRPFEWEIVKDKVDPYLTYRLIEPDYEVFNNLSLRERCVENFDERSICDYVHVGNRCMNCHTFGNQDPRLSMLYVRGEGGGAVLNQDGKLRKLGLKTADMLSGSVYFSFSPTGRYITFSTNLIIPAFHSAAKKRLEVYDSASDVYVADLQENTVIRSALLSDSLTFETFPTFAPDGRHIYFCTAAHVDLPQDLRKLQYRLCRIGFDEKKGQLGTKVDTLDVPTSVCHPRISPDGRWLLFTIQDYGTFPIWHRESDLRMLDLQTGRLATLDNVNSDKSDTYHSWSSNSRWFVFASKRDDGLYGKPYFCYVDRRGRAHKPFCLPQKDPTFYDQCLKSFNAPELGKGRVPFTANDVKRTMLKEAEPFE